MVDPVTTHRTYTLVIRDCPKSMNDSGGGSRANPYAAAREKKHWEGIYLQQFMIEKVKRGMTRCHATITVRWKRRNGADKTNYYASIVKPLADALAPPKNSQATRWLPDDTQDFFDVTLKDFEYPSEWPRNALHRVELIIELEAEYA